jgi:SprB repeat
LQCTTVLTVSLSNSVAPQLAIAPTNGTCGTNNGSIDLTITGGVPNYTIDWDNITGASDPEDQTGLGAGNYAVTVTDMNGCTAVGSVLLEVARGVTLTCRPSSATTPPGGNGSIAVTVTEVGPYTFDWNVDALDGIQNPTGLSAGTYNLVVTDANGCISACETEVEVISSVIPTIADPCVCHDVEYDPNEGYELLDYIEVTDVPGKTWQLIVGTGMELIDPINNIPMPIPSTLTYDAGTGRYRIRFAHTANVGYSATVSDGTYMLSISNNCRNRISRLPTTSII